MKPKQKYVWADITFDEWIRKQQKKIGQSGFKIGTAGVTKKLVNEILEPNEIDLSTSLPKMTLRKKKKNGF